jgi:hypothetical protein
MSDNLQAKELLDNCPEAHSAVPVLQTAAQLEKCGINHVGFKEIYGSEKQRVPKQDRLIASAHLDMLNFHRQAIALGRFALQRHPKQAIIRGISNNDGESNSSNTGRLSLPATKQASIYNRSYE